MSSSTQNGIEPFLVGGRVLERLEKKDFKLGGYLIDRVARLYPVYIACLLLGWGLDWLGYTYFSTSIYTASQENPIGVIGYNALSRMGVNNFLINLFMLQGLIGSSFGSNGPLWSIAMEFWYYLTFPLLLLPFYVESWRKRLICIFALIIVLYLLSLNLEFYALFAVWLLGVLVRKIKVPIRNTNFAFLLLMLFLANARFGYGNQYSRDLLVGIGCMFIIAAVLNGGSFLHFGSNFSRIAANFSYSIYCFHFPVIAFVTAYMNFNVNEAIMPMPDRYAIFIFVCMLCIGVSFLLSRITEVNTINIRNFFKKLILQVKISKPI